MLRMKMRQKLVLSLFLNISTATLFGRVLSLPSNQNNIRHHHPEPVNSRKTAVRSQISESFENQHGTNAFPCDYNISNDTHISWPVTHSGGDSPRHDKLLEETCWCQTYEDTFADAFVFLKANMMPFDLPNSGTLGFKSYPKHSGFHRGTDVEQETIAMERNLNRESTNALPDGLSDGIVLTSIKMALDAKINYPWTRNISREIFFEYVVNYANVNEARNDWRPLMHNALQPILSPLLNDENTDATVEDVVKTINRDIWTALGKTRITSPADAKGPPTAEVDALYFKAGQTPLVYDPMSIMSYGYGSCTGLSILLVDALRAAGIPARLVGTPAWDGKVENGNHNWVEVYSVAEGKWKFCEPAYGDYGTDKADNLDRDPCDRWFCNKSRFGKDTGTKAFAARINREESGGLHYPMAWDFDNVDVPGEDRTAYYRDICGEC